MIFDIVHHKQHTNKTKTYPISDVSRYVTHQVVNQSERSHQSRVSYGKKFSKNNRRRINKLPAEFSTCGVGYFAIGANVLRGRDQDIDQSESLTICKFRKATNWVRTIREK